MLREIFAFSATLITATAFASTVYVQRAADGSVSYGDATTMSPKASIKTIKPAAGRSAHATTASAASSNQTLDVLNKMEQQNIKDIAESRARVATLLKQANQEKNDHIRSRLLNQIEAENQSTELYTANINQIRKNKEAINKEQTL